MKAHGYAFSIAAVALLAISIMSGANAQQPGNAAAAGHAKSTANSLQEITLPQYPPQMPPGPNLESFESHCLLCHSARYVTMQPRFSRPVWEKEVKKMVDVYGAPISPAEQQQIVEYLIAIKGTPEAK